MYAIAPLSRFGSSLFWNAALIANTVSALERPAITILARRSAIGNIERAAWGFRQSAALTFGFQNSRQSNIPIQPLPPYRPTHSCLRPMLIILSLVPALIAGYAFGVAARSLL